MTVLRASPRFRHARLDPGARIKSEDDGVNRWVQVLDRLVTAERVRAYALMLVAGYALGVAGWALSIRHGVDPLGKPLGGDFIIFYAASALALKGKALAAYAPSVLLAAERSVAAGSRGLFLWCYPPTFQLVAAPLALVPYGWALAGWTGMGLAAYLAMTRWISRAPGALLLACAFPAVLLNALQGQNGFLTAALLGAGLLGLDRRPWLAGAALGLLAFKPQLAVLVPLLLVASGRWRSLAGGALSAGGFVLVATAAFGVESWRAFLAFLPQVSHNLAAGALPLFKDPSLYAGLRLLGAPHAAALGANLALAAAAAGLTVLAWRRPGPLPLKAALAVLATLIASPYAFDYDLVLLAIPLGVLAEHGRTHALAPGAKALMALGFAAPVAMLAASFWLHLQPMPAVLLALYAATWRAFGGASTPGALGQTES